MDELSFLLDGIDLDAIRDGLGSKILAIVYIHVIIVRTIRSFDKDKDK